MKKVAIVGSTGSIGRQALSIIEENPDRFEVVALSANKNVSLMKEQAEKFRPGVVAMADQDSAVELEGMVNSGISVVGGDKGVIHAASETGADILLSSAVGSAGLPPTIAAIDMGIDIALANKETLVSAGKIVTERAKERGVKLIPVDSEHSAIFQSLGGLSGYNHENGGDIKRLILTASGGPFLGKGIDELAMVTPEEAKKHPRWDMGAKISIDSATMMNKALEVIEARWLFDVEGDRIDIIIHPQSIVHSLVEFIDGGVIAQLGTTDMRIPIAYAISYPERITNTVPPLNLTEISGGLEFIEPDFGRFPAIPLAYRALESGGSMAAVMSAANESAVGLFLSGRLRFPEIVNLVSEVMGRHRVIPDPSLEELLEIDLWARGEAEKIWVEL